MGRSNVRFAVGRSFEQLLCLRAYQYRLGLDQNEDHLGRIDLTDGLFIGMPIAGFLCFRDHAAKLTAYRGQGGRGHLIRGPGGNHNHARAH